MIAGRYTLDREIGRGGMGAVWLGRDELLGRPVALKRVGMPPAGAGHSPEQARAQREAKLAASLSHPHVVSVFDLAPDGDDQWLVMEHVEGTNLAELIKANGRLTPDEAAPLLAQTADALIAAHRAGVVHRDVKPSNILVTADGQVKLSDFGIARTLGDPSLTQTGLVTGSPAYLSPEVASGRSATGSSDIWSLGATAYHAIEGHPPYELGDNLLGALYRIVHEDPPRPSAPGWLQPLFEATMTAEADRWDAHQVRDFLLAGPGAATAATPTVAVRGRARRPSRAATPVTPVTPAPPAAPTVPLVDAGVHHTQVLPPARPPQRPVAATDDPPRGRRLTWVLAAAAIVAAVLVAVVLWRVLGDGEDPAGTTARPTPTPTSAEPSPSQPAGPTAAGMRTFIQDYLASAPADPSVTFDMLTPGFQEESGGLGRYTAFWRSVSDVQVGSVRADPQTLRVVYDYTYRQNGTARDDTVTLVLAWDGTTYRIDRES